MHFDLKRPCKDCPFIKGTTMVLSPGRMEGIVEALRDDHTVFPCHKTTHRGDDEAEDASEDGEDDEGGGYRFNGNERACMGALAYQQREYGMMPVLARIACMRGDLKPETIKENADDVEEPGKWEAY